MTAPDPTPPDQADELARVLPLWPELAARLGERRAAFVAAAQERALRYGLTAPLLQARFFNLCCALGPGFEERPEHEAALALLLDERLPPAVRMHQVLLRVRTVMERRGGDVEVLQHTDQSLLDDAESAANDPASVLRQACDLDAFELRVRDAEPLPPYVLQPGAWQRGAPRGEPAPVRVSATQPAPARIHLLGAAESLGAPLTVQLRQAPHGQCRHRLHPAARWVGRHGLSSWQGPVAKECSWPVSGPEWAAEANALGEESSPDITVLELPNCGLRDEGVPLGPQTVQLWCHAAHQRLWTLHRRAPLRWTDRDGLQAAEGTRLHLERDGEALPLQAWRTALEQTLPAVWAQGMAQLLTHWQQAVQTTTATAEAQALWFDGRAACAWGWQPAATGLLAPPDMRLAVDAELQHALRIRLEGELRHGGAAARVQLSCEGDQALQWRHEHVGAAAVPAALQALKVSWRWPWQLRFDPLVGEGSLLIGQLGPCTGALVGEAGLRPRTEGSGWAWYLQLSTEPVASPVRVHDAVLGQSDAHLALLPSLTLIDWSQG